MKTKDIAELRDRFWYLFPTLTIAAAGDQAVMPGGKHVGKRLYEVPRGYLRWYAANVISPFAEELKEFLGNEAGEK